MKSGFNNKWKRRKDYSKFWYNCGIFIALYLRLYKIEYTLDHKWHIRTYILSTRNEWDCVKFYFNNHSLTECKNLFRAALIEEWNTSKIYDDKAQLVGEVLRDLVAECWGFDDLVKGMHYIGNTKKIIEELQKLEK